MVHKEEGRGWRKKRGDFGEQTALDYLLSRGYHLLARNYRYERGEIDLVVEEEGTIVFVEVKTRRSNTFGEPEHSVTPRKQTQIRRIAEGFLYERGLGSRPSRFDVIAISLAGRTPEIVHYQHAFY